MLTEVHAVEPDFRAIADREKIESQMSILSCTENFECATKPSVSVEKGSTLAEVTTVKSAKTWSV